MLVLTRKENQRILFPHLGVTVQILRIAGNGVRVGVEAPSDVRILREEIAGDGDMAAANEARRARRHELRNRLNTANLALHVLKKQLDAAMFEDAEATLERSLHEFAKLDQFVGDSAPAPRCELERRSQRRALLVEDDANERELLADFLRMSGYEVDVAEDGLKAMTYLSEHRQPDLVLLDMQMPRMDGRKTISAIRGNPAYRSLKVFAVSGSDRQSLNVPLGDRGVDHWFSKPLKPSELVEELEAQLAP